MKSFAVLALAGAALAQSSPPSGCQPSTSGTFQISTVNVTSPRKRDLETRQLAGVLTLSLQNGNLRDQAGRTGYIASNYQFQFDAPVQAGARESTGFSLCNNGSLALGSTAIWYQCLSGTFYNLYSQSTGAQCIPIYITAVRQGGASQISDGQPQATSQRPAVSQISDGQPQASSPRPVVSQISDGQPQAGTPRPTPAPVVSQISDGQPQVGTPRPTSRAVVSQISDGQPQVPVVTPRPVVSQISDGQPQVPIATRTGNLTAPNATRSAPAQFTGAAATGNAATGALLAGLLGLFAML
ncbi:hypothetical protein CC86DRAFT_284826 [Ophiobolus disseminans]|uniref:Cell wall mannoprotein PIR1-like C-terminal domain-containing protein n=1 Tax=Ophiobolus disseminans TaxID=1469910 RepID=A0A6A7AAZ7_9PLEO|nr:hypothetical protein CC86DRAFT_284826 [Ophiobolus disseminans]